MATCDDAVSMTVFRSSGLARDSVRAARDFRREESVLWIELSLIHHFGIAPVESVLSLYR